MLMLVSKKSIVVFAIWAKALWFERQRRQFMCEHKSMLTSLSLSSKLVLKVKHQDDASFCWVCHRRLYGILPKEHPETFYGVPWVPFKEMSTYIQGQSDIVTRTTNI
jgi:hypothetical protein